jgi:nucleotide-binding universal stress UspA family protein
MNRVLLAVDDSKGSENVVKVFFELYACTRPEAVLLLYIQKPEGRSLMDEMLGVAEMSTLKEELKGTEHQKELNKRAEAVLSHYRGLLEERGVMGIKTIVKEGHPAEEILSTAEKEGAGLIIIGSRGRRLHNFLMGSVSREVANRANVPVMLAK